MKILGLTSSFPLGDGNTDGSFIFDHFSHLKVISDNEITVLCPHSRGAKSFEQKNGLNIHRFVYFYPYALEYLAYDEGLPYKIMNSPLAKIQVPFFIMSELIYSIVFIWQKDIDLINSHWLIPQGLVGSICKKFFGITHIATVHSSEISVLKRIPFGKFLMSFIINHVDILVSVSSHRSNEILEFLPPILAENARKKLRIVPMGTDVARNLNQQNKDAIKSKYGINSQYVVLFVGRLVEVKGCIFLLENFSRVVKEICSIKLLILGNGPLESELKNYVSSQGLHNNVMFMGFIEHDSMKDFYSIADIVVVPSIVDSYGYQEGLPVVVIESLSCGIPVIGTNTNGIAEAIIDHHNGILVDPQNSEQIAEAIINLLSNHDLRTFLSKNALVSAEKYHWDTVAGEYWIIFNEAAKR